MEPLPEDIYRCIIDLLQDDKTALNNSSLVAKSWQAPCHLLSKLRVSVSDPVSHTADIDSFSRFLDDSPHIREYVRALDISAIRRNGESD